MVSRTSIMETLDKIVNGPNPIQPKYTVGFVEKVFLDIRQMFVEHTFVTLLCIGIVGYIGFTWYRGRNRGRGRTRGVSFRADDPRGMKDMKDGLLGSVSNGNQKSD